MYEQNVRPDLIAHHTPSNQPSVILRSELAEVGINSHFPDQAHHIIPINQARDAISHMERLGVMGNSSANGVLLPSFDMPGNPQQPHSFQYSGMMSHGEQYVRRVSRDILNCTSAEQVTSYINTVRLGLLDGSINIYE